MKKYNGLRSYSNSKKLVTAPEKIVRGGKTERLSYINDDEASVLKRLGGSGEKTKWGVKSYKIRSGGSQEDNTSETQEKTQAPSEAAKEGYSPYENIFGNIISADAQKRFADEALRRSREDTMYLEGGRGGGGGYRRAPQNRTEYRDSPDQPTLEKLYALRGDPSALQTYIDEFDNGGTTTETNETGGTTTIITRPGNEGIPTDFATKAGGTDYWATDSKGNILGWKNEQGEPHFKNKNQWMFDGDEESWVFVGEGSLEGGGGTGTTQILTPDGKSKTVGARTYAQKIGYDIDKVRQAEKQRATQVAELKRIAERYGGKYDEETGEFLGGGLEEKNLEQANKAEMELMRIYGIDVRTTDPKTGETTLQKGSDYWKKMEDEAGELPTSMQDMLAGKRADEITASETEQMTDLRKQMADRGMDPNSPQAIRMMQKIKETTRTAKRGARRGALEDAMNIKRQQQEQDMARIGARASGLGSIAAGKRAQANQYAAIGIGARSDLTNLTENTLREQGAARLAGTQMQMARHGSEQDRALAERIAKMEASGGGGKRNKLLGALGGAFAGGVQGYKATGGNWYGAAAGAAGGFFSGLS